MRLFLELKPNKANLYFNIIPMVTLLLLLVLGALFKSFVLIFLFFSFMFIFFYFGLFWRFFMGQMTYKFVPSKLRRNVTYRFFLAISILNFIVLPLFVGLIFIVKADFRFIVGFILFVFLYGFVSNYFQFQFISQNISILKYGEEFRKNKKPLSWITLAYFPMTALKTQTVINDIFSDRIEC